MKSICLLALSSMALSHAELITKEKAYQKVHRADENQKIFDSLMESAESVELSVAQIKDLQEQSHDKLTIQGSGQKWYNGWATLEFGCQEHERTAYYGIRLWECAMEKGRGTSYSCYRENGAYTIMKYDHGENSCGNWDSLNISSKTFASTCHNDHNLTCTDQLTPYWEVDGGILQLGYNKTQSYCSGLPQRFSWQNPMCRAYKGWSEKASCYGGQWSYSFYENGKCKGYPEQSFSGWLSSCEDYADDDYYNNDYSYYLDDLEIDDVLPDSNADLNFYEFCLQDRTSHVMDMLQGTHYGYCVQTAYSNKDGSRGYCMNDGKKEHDVLSMAYIAEFKGGKYRYSTNLGTGVDDNSKLRTYAEYSSDWMSFDINAEDRNDICLYTSEGYSFVVGFDGGFYNETGIYRTENNMPLSSCYGYPMGASLDCDNDYTYQYVCRSTKRGKNRKND